MVRKDNKGKMPTSCAEALRQAPVSYAEQPTICTNNSKPDNTGNTAWIFPCWINDNKEVKKLPTALKLKYLDNTAWIRYNQSEAACKHNSVVISVKLNLKCNNSNKSITRLVENVA